MLSELAIDNKEAFADLVTIAKDALAGKTYTPKAVTIASKKEDAVVTEKKEEKKPATKKTTTTKTTEKKATAKKTTAKKETK